MKVLITENQLKTVYQKIVDISLNNLRDKCEHATEDEDWDYADEDIDCEILNIVENVEVATSFDNEIGLIIYIDTIFDSADVGSFFYDIKGEIMDMTGNKNIKIKLLNVINNNLKYFNNNDTNKLELEIEQLKLMLEMKSTNNDNILIQELVQSVKQLSCQINNLEKTNQEMMAKLNSAQMKTTTGFNEPLVTLGPRLQKINPETMIIIKVYESVAECLKEHNFKIKRPSIDKAVTENTVYNGFRWAFVDRNLDPNVLYNILPTKQTKIQNLGYIAKLNTEKTEILNVYLDRKTAASLNGYASSSALDTPVKNASLTNGHYYLLYDKCPQELIDTFEKKYGEPILYKDGIGQYTNENQLVKEFICKYDCIKQLKMSDKTLTKALDNNILYNNFFFCRIGSKMKWI